MKSRIYLIRHGITEGNLKRWYYGALDLPLHEKGVDQLVALAKKKIYPPMNRGEFFTTGLLRTEQTLFLLYGDKPHQVIEELKEMDFGIFEGHTYEEIKDHSEFQKWIEDENFAFTEGESQKGFSSRVNAGFQKLLSLHQLQELKHMHNKEDTDSLMICHGGVIAHIMSKLFPETGKNFFQWIPEPGEGYVVDIIEGSPADFGNIGEKL